MFLFIFTQHTYPDSVLETLAGWLSAELPTISVVEDLVDDPTGSSAQPLSSFHLDNLSSPLLVLTHALRLRILGARLSASCALAAGGRSSRAFFLDLDVSKLLHSLPRLRHLVLDHCNLFDDAHTRDWAVFGHHCMLERKDLNLERPVNRRLAALGGASGPGGSHLRGVRILPRVSALRKLSLSVPAHVDADARRVLLAEFRRGWTEAVVMFNGIVSATWRSRTEEGVYSFVGMVVVDDNDEFSQLSEVRGAEGCPVVCLAGREEGIEHAEGCGHSIGWDIWEDAL
ncbi:hypothetical protein EDB89DRAFT_2234457 [Lactarius sanguifluus]|nr:hypothetical protein EDB89DRAFT_2234457 [Lactarius sanguifluus]